MRKLVIVLVMLMAAGMVFAATHATVSQSNDSAASVTITLPLASSDDYESIEVGFSSSEVTANGTGADDRKRPFKHPVSDRGVGAAL